MMAVKKADKPAAFSKEQILKSTAFTNRKDILTVLIKDDEELTLTEVQNRLDKFMKGKVS
mgnify:CR=1 FL=1